MLDFLARRIFSPGGMAEKLDIFFAADKLSGAEYTELTAMLDGA